VLGEDQLAFLLEVAHVAERTDRAGEEDVPAGDLACLASELHAARVDALELLLQVVLGELVAIRAKGVRLDQLGAGADEPEVQREHALRVAQICLLGAAQAAHRARDQRAHATVATNRRAVCQPLEETLGHDATLKGYDGTADRDAELLGARGTNGTVACGATESSGGRESAASLSRGSRRAAEKSPSQLAVLPCSIRPHR
jgi:hypothetical protein